jgi:hypothetical protein
MTPHREILRLHSRGISLRGIAISCQCSRNTVARIVARAQETNLTWPLKEELSDSDLEKILFPDSTTLSSPRKLPDLDYLHQELFKSGVTLRLLWTEYCTSCRLANEQPLMYSQFLFFASRKSPLLQNEFPSAGGDF